MATTRASACNCADTRQLSREYRGPEPSGIGGCNAVGEASRTRRKEELVASQAEVLLVAFSDSSTERALMDLAELVTRSGRHQLPCVQANQVIVPGGNQCSKRPGPKLTNRLKILSILLHPETALPNPGIHRARRFETH